MFAFLKKICQIINRRQLRRLSGFHKDSVHTKSGGGGWIYRWSRICWSLRLSSGGMWRLCCDRGRVPDLLHFLEQHYHGDSRSSLQGLRHRNWSRPGRSQRGQVFVVERKLTILFSLTFHSGNKDSFTEFEKLDLEHKLSLVLASVQGITVACFSF